MSRKVKQSPSEGIRSVHKALDLLDRGILPPLLKERPIPTAKRKGKRSGSFSSRLATHWPKS